MVRNTSNPWVNLLPIGQRDVFLGLRLRSVEVPNVLGESLLFRAPDGWLIDLLWSGEILRSLNHKLLIRKEINPENHRLFHSQVGFFVGSPRAYPLCSDSILLTASVPRASPYAEHPKNEWKQILNHLHLPSIPEYCNENSRWALKSLFCPQSQMFWLVVFLQFGQVTVSPSSSAQFSSSQLRQGK